MFNSQRQRREPLLPKKLMMHVVPARAIRSVFRAKRASHVIATTVAQRLNHIALIVPGMEVQLRRLHHIHVIKGSIVSNA